MVKDLQVLKGVLRSYELQNNVYKIDSILDGIVTYVCFDGIHYCEISIKADNALKKEMEADELFELKRITYFHIRVLKDAKVVKSIKYEL